MADDDGVVVTSDGRRIRPVKSVTRAIGVLDALGDGESMGLTELATAIGCSKTAAYNLVTTLELRGLVRKLADHRYALGWKLLELGEVVRWSSTFGDPAHAEVVALSESTGETAILGVLDRDTTVCVELVESSRSVPLAVARGSREPADEGAVGQVLIAFSPAARKRRLIEHLDPEGAEGLALRIERVREGGFAVVEHRGEIGVAAPVFDYSGEAVAAVAVIGPDSRLPADRIDQVVAAVAAAGTVISSGLGAGDRRRAASSAR
jgi:DNA-binding IclR family transcriptional regulator